MTLFQACVLGLVQGLSEFLPISSSAHLILVREVLGWPDPGIAFDVALHWGTLLGVFIYFWSQIMNIVKGGVGFLKGERQYINYLPLYVLVGCLVPGVVGLTLEHFAEETFRSPWIIVVTLSVVAIVMYKADKLTGQNRALSTMGWTEALMIGSAQAIALIPGVSRSGITICTALFLGFSRVSAVEFSFLCSIPLILGAGATKISYIVQGMTDPILIAGILSSALAGYGAILFLMSHVKTKSLTPFVIYRLALAAVIMIWLLTRATP